MTGRPGIEYISAGPICNSSSPPRRRQGIPAVKEAKNTARALVRIGFDGRVHKSFRAADAQKRFENELRVLLYLQERGCEFVPRIRAVSGFLKTMFKADPIMQADTSGQKLLDALLETDSSVAVFQNS